MNNEDYGKIKDILADSLTGIHARTEAQYTIIENKLDGITNHLKTLNGKVAQHEKRLNSDDIQHATRETTCPYREIIVQTSEDTKFKKRLTKGLIGVLGIINIILIITLSLSSLSEKFNNSKVNDNIENEKSS